MKNINVYGLYENGKLVREIKIPKAKVKTISKKLKPNQELCFHYPTGK